MKIDRKKEFKTMIKLMATKLENVFNYYGNCENCEHSLCCKINIPVIKDYEIRRIANYLKITQEEFKNKLIRC
jgi:hypothetical protein